MSCTNTAISDLVVTGGQTKPGQAAAACQGQAHGGEGRYMDDDRRLLIYERKNEPARVLALSDGVFAIVITLLVLELQVPDPHATRPSGKRCVRSGPRFVAFIISFIVVAIAWAGRRDLFSLIHRTDRALVWFNIAYLLPLSILPFGASLIARYDGILFTAYVRYTPGCRHSHPPGYLGICDGQVVSPVQTRGYADAMGGGSHGGRIRLAYATAIAIAEEAPTASLAIYAAGPVLYFITILVARSFAPPGSEEQGFA